LHVKTWQRLIWAKKRGQRPQFFGFTATTFIFAIRLVFESDRLQNLPLLISGFLAIKLTLPGVLLSSVSLEIVSGKFHSLFQTFSSQIAAASAQFDLSSS
jgi:hypothetical protein